jgi:hypothetical protein
MDAEELIRQAADSVRSALDEAQRRAQEILAQAESEARAIRAEAEAAATRIRAEAEDAAGRIRGEAEGQAEQRLEEVRGALDELRGRLSREGEAPAGPKQETPDARPTSQAAPEPQPDSEPNGDEVSTGAGAPSTDELMVRLKAGSGEEPAGPSSEGPGPSPEDHGSRGEAAARLVAMNLALDGTPRAEVRARLADDYEVDDLDALLDEVYAKAAG